MDICTTSMNANQNSYIRIFNLSYFTLRVAGRYYIEQTGTLFSTPSCPPGFDIKVAFPQNAYLVSFTAVMWVATESKWITFANVSKLLPGQYCFRAFGTTIIPSLIDIPCPNNIIC